MWQSFVSFPAKKQAKFLTDTYYLLRSLTAYNNTFEVLSRPKTPQKVAGYGEDKDEKEPDRFRAIYVQANTKNKQKIKRRSKKVYNMNHRDKRLAEISMAWNILLAFHSTKVIVSEAIPTRCQYKIQRRKH